MLVTKLGFRNVRHNGKKKKKEKEEGGGLNQQEELAEATVERAVSGLRSQASLLTDADLEGHHLVQRTLQPGGPQAAAVMRTLWKGQRKCQPVPQHFPAALRPGQGLASTKCQSKTFITLVLSSPLGPSLTGGSLLPRLRLASGRPQSSSPPPPRASG